ncbi:hypothetical protein EVAR_36971_1 [Eumeta japonica]|uniref:Uncharacterized protein n=1 Tax=Eumeta variegata TaxID=151549 RepID=A0A4C1W6Z9_EUMVA|nr:hypothetical protein EVAR_36971_1 [Eumeta japonica]
MRSVRPSTRRIPQPFAFTHNRRTDVYDDGHDQLCPNLKLQDTVVQISPSSIYIVKPSYESHKLELAKIGPCDLYDRRPVAYDSPLHYITFIPFYTLVVYIDIRFERKGMKFKLNERMKATPAAGVRENVTRMMKILFVRAPRRRVFAAVW